MFRIAIIIVLLLFSWISFGQSEPTKVYLKDGSILVGHIVEDNDYLIRIAIASIDTIDVGYKLIESVGEAPRNLRRNRKDRIRPEPVVKTSGLFLSAFGAMYKAGANSDFSVRPELIIGSRVHKNLNLGLLMGYETHEFSTNIAFGASEFVTIGAYGRYYGPTKKYRWFIDSQLGYGIPTTEEIWPPDYSHTYEGGVNAHSGLGMHFDSRQKYSFLLRLGAGYQHVSGNIESNWNGEVTTKYRKEYIYPYFSVGVEF